MNYIVLDIEHNCPYENGKTHKIVQNKKCPFEIIEIGAVKLDENFNQVDTFRIYVKPSFYHIISYKVTKITKITIDDLKQGFTFIESIKYFKQWIGTDYIMCAWSVNDYIVMQQNCKYHYVDFDFFKNYIDVQNLYNIYIDGHDPSSLKNAIEYFNIPLENQLHNALHDAYYTSKILQAMKGVDIRLGKYFEPYNSDKKMPKLRCPLCGKFIKQESFKPSRRLRNNNMMVVIGECNSCQLRLMRKITTIHDSIYNIKDVTLSNQEYNRLKNKWNEKEYQI